MTAGVALITGASRGIGKGIALALAAAGYHIAGMATKADPDNQESGLYRVKGEVEAHGVQFLPLAGNIAALDEHESLIAQSLSAFGRIDVLVNNAGVAPLQRRDMMHCLPESFDRLTDINLRGPFFFTQGVARQMLRQVEEGTSVAPKIIFITSVSSRIVSTNRAEYCISKAGLSMAAQCFAAALAPQGINVYDLQPGIIATDMSSAAKEKYDRLIAEGLLLNERWGSPEDVGKAVVGLCAGYFDYSPGAVIEVGGGLGMQRL